MEPSQIQRGLFEDSGCQFLLGSSRIDGRQSFMLLCFACYFFLNRSKTDISENLEISCEISPSVLSRLLPRLDLFGRIETEQ